MKEAIASFSGSLSGEEERMGLAIYLARHNAERGGGPFGAAVFAGDTLVAVGVNQVLACGFSIAHAEVVALMQAQQSLGEPASARRRPVTLVTSAEPCCQCFGALIWAGVERLVCGATTGDVEAIGFDEGPKPVDWTNVLQARGIEVVLGVRQDEARGVLSEYARRGGTIYGPSKPTVG
jgi:tRNA(Arg) A34 adenosine deaminase TadA